ncbi:class I adenylate-forming enzyme family protein [Alkalibacillus aidingensis]|uniref:class I adenylate-forming enzyme family protein n=1 Tax=Alkalibacillus aidingensis TaxID=2747607 RepID=UPI0016607EC4|nr:AMP-binding protein [Alkalibacillus aidingensis]
MLGELDWLSSRAKLYPNDEAIVDVDEGYTVTYRELNKRSQALAEGLTGFGLEKGDRVALLAPNHISYFDLLFASMKTGLIFVPLNWRLSKEELLYVLEDCQPKLVLVHRQFSDEVTWVNKRYPSLTIDGPHYVDQLEKKSLQTVHIQETTPLAMIYTGGTTGKPKGAVLSHRSILWNGINTVISWGISKQDTTLTAIPMFHTGGLNALSVPVLLAGGKVIIHSAFEPERAVEDLIKFRCTIVLFIPTMYHMITETDLFKVSEFPHMKVFLSGGAPCPLTIYRKFNEKGLSFKEGYGLTEAGPNNFYIHPVEAQVKNGSVGREMIFNDISIVNRDGDEVPSDEVGELRLKGKHLFEYYWDNDEATTNQFVGEWFKTGDLARRDEEGCVYIVGRKKEMIISGGENIYPLEIEHWLDSHPDINEVAVVGVPDDYWGEKVVAFLSKTSSELNTSELVTFCAQKLSRYKIPKEFVFLDELPKTHVGKINKNALLEVYQ